MEYPQQTDPAPVSVQILRELTSPQTLRFIVVIGLLLLVGYELIFVNSLTLLRDPFMLVVGTMFEPISRAVSSRS